MPAKSMPCWKTGYGSRKLSEKWKPVYKCWDPDRLVFGPKVPECSEFRILYIQSEPEFDIFFWPGEVSYICIEFRWEQFVGPAESNMFEAVKTDSECLFYRKFTPQVSKNTDSCFMG